MKKDTYCSENPLKSTLNSRFLPTGDRRFIRSDFPKDISNEDIEWLYKNNFRTFVDLRSEEECRRRPCSLKNYEQFTYYNLPVTGGNYIPDSIEEVEQTYFNMIDDKMSNIIYTIVNASTNVMYFCSAGKDRTGVVSAIILKLYGISDDIIIDDYMESAKSLPYYVTKSGLKFPDSMLSLLIPRKETIKKVLDFLNHK